MDFSAFVAIAVLFFLVFKTVLEQKEQKKNKKEEAARLAKLRQEREEREKRIKEMPQVPLQSSIPVYPFQTPYVIIDVETTGLNPSTDKIIQLTAIKYSPDGTLIGTYTTYLNPEIPIPPRITKINGITDKDVQDAPVAAKVYSQFLSFISNLLLVGYNVTFDLRFLAATFGESLYTRNYIDILPIVRKRMICADYKLQTVATKCGFIPKENFHNSLTDCKAVAAILYRIGEDLSSETKEFRYVASTPKFESSAYIRDKSFEQGFRHWSKGEEARAQGDFENALRLFDLAQSVGYSSPALYTSYAKVYRKLKDYESEISILDEALNQFKGDIADRFQYRRSRAKSLLQAQQRRDVEQREKELERAEKAEIRQRKKELEQSQPKKPTSRPVAQCSDDGAVIREFQSVSEAAAEIGITPKCIRDAASGKQKHAGGYCWKYIKLDLEE